jgi:cell division protein FtsQ
LKKINYKKVLITVLWIIAIAGLTSTLGFVAVNEKEILATEMEINIHNNEENLFLSETDVKQFFEQRGDEILNKKYKQINIPELERALNSHPAVENAEVSADLNGLIRISVVQRTPVLRIINKNGESYYIDKQSKLMPLNENYSARVLIANGEINEPYARRYQYSVEQMKKSKVYKEITLLDDVLDVASHINKDSSLTALIHQINVNKQKEIELYPAIGNHKIVFGDAQNIIEKFNKLRLFYKEGLSKSDNWTKYAVINLKYKNLVVCTKK